MGYISEAFLKDFATKQKGYIDKSVEPVSKALGLEDIPVFSTTKPYSMGDFVLYEGKLYKFEVNHKGVWNDNDAVQTTLYDEVDELGKVANEQIVVILSINNEDDIPTFDVNEDYEDGDFIKYNDELYRFVTNHSAGAWDSTEVVKGLSNIVVNFNVEGEENVRTVYTDANGKASTIVTKGLLVNIEIDGLKGYYDPSPIEVRASLAKRNLYVTYAKNNQSNYESVTIYFKYPEATETKATSINVVYDNTDHTIYIQNDIAEFLIPIGTEYRIIYPEVGDYRTPGTVSTVAKNITRIYNAFYEDYNLGLSWIKYDGSEVPINSVTLDDKPDIAGIKINSSMCVPFMLRFPFVQLSVSSSKIVVPEYSSHEAALESVDGEGKCLQRINAGDTAFPSIYNIICTINGIDKHGFIPSYAQLVQLYNVRNSITKYSIALQETFTYLSGTCDNAAKEYNQVRILAYTGSFSRIIPTYNAFLCYPL